MTKKDLSVVYCVSVRTLNRWIKPFSHELGNVNGRYFSPKQVSVIYEKLGDPLN